MKKIFKYVPIILGLVMVMSSCGEDDETEPAVALAPTLTVSVNGNQVSNGATVNVETGSSVTLAITANRVGSGSDLNTMTITQSGDNVVTPFNIQAGANDPYNFADGSPQTLRNADDETFLGTGIFNNITSSVGSTTYNITVTDKDELSTTVSISIVVADPATAFTMTKTGTIYHIEGLARGSWSLETDTTVSKAMSETMADIRNTNAAGDPFTGAFRVGTSRTTTDFVIAGSGFDYDNATVTSATAAYNAGTVDADNADVPSVGSVYIFSVNGTITAVKVMSIDPSNTTGGTGNPGAMTFEYKK